MNNIKIYGVELDNKIYYVGKTNKIKTKYCKSDIQEIYHNSKLQNIVKNNNVNIVSIKDVSLLDWYSEKINEVVKKYKDGHPLLNSDWMKNGKRSYWDGKKRDKNTITKLAESKHKKYLQYDNDGNLIKIWNCGKDIAIQIFNDYECKYNKFGSKFYQIVKNKNVNNRFMFNSYWFSYNEIYSRFSEIPEKIKISELYYDFLNQKNKNKKQVKLPKYKILIFSNDIQILEFNDAFLAAKHFNFHPVFVRKLCRLNLTRNNLQFKYGEKTII